MQYKRPAFAGLFMKKKTIYNTIIFRLYRALFLKLLERWLQMPECGYITVS